ncbi:MAG: AbrB/MazE/SpoVT family DNA-binding domain-containing protein [Trueperaceae bacterium]|nr:AbrB/MazE/SpoVT family DNA-binding domain-containing protein [Trueperaceae bacterium]
MNDLAQGYRMWHDDVGMADASAFVRLKLGPQGRVVLPAHFRRALGLEVGDPLIASVEGGRIMLEPTDAALERLIARFDAAGGGPSVVDELIAERRAAACREAEESEGRS